MRAFTALMSAISNDNTADDLFVYSYKIHKTFLTYIEDYFFHFIFKKLARLIIYKLCKPIRTEINNIFMIKLYFYCHIFYQRINLSI